MARSGDLDEVAEQQLTPELHWDTALQVQCTFIIGCALHATPERGHAHAPPKHETVMAILMSSTMASCLGMLPIYLCSCDRRRQSRTSRGCTT